MLLDGSLAAARDSCAASTGPIVDVGSGGGAPGIPLAAALPEREVTLLEAEPAASASSCERWTAELPNLRVVWGRAEEQPTDAFGVAVAKALAQPPVAAEWCLPLVAPGGAVGPLASARAPTRAGRARSPSGWPPSSAGVAAGPARAAEARPDAGRASRAGPAWPENVRSRSSAALCAGKIYALANQKGGVGKTTTAVNLAACLAEAGERALVVDLDPQANATSGLGERANGTRRSTCSTGSRCRSSPSRRASRNLDLVPSQARARGRGRRAGAALPTASATSRTRWPRPASELRLRLRRLPAFARAADRERARGRRSRARSGAGRVLRARGTGAARRLGRARAREAEPEADHRRRDPDHGRRPHAPCGRRLRRGAPALRRARVQDARCPARCASPRRRATACL